MAAGAPAAGEAASSSAGRQDTACAAVQAGEALAAPHEDPGLADAVDVVANILNHSGLDSAWTSALASGLQQPAERSAAVRQVLQTHGWVGRQFKSPPDRRALLKDLKAVARRGGDEDVPTICLIGATGAGKSSTGNTLFGSLEPIFKVVENTMASVTSAATVEERPWRGSGQRVRIVDSPGLGDTEGRDAEHIAGLADILKSQVEYVNAFLIVFNSQEPRLTCHLKDMLLTFREMFGEGFLRHVIIAFTRWEYDAKAQRRRKKAGAGPEERARILNEELRKVLGHSFECPCAFLDNSITGFTAEELEEEFGEELPAVLGEFEAELAKVLDFALTRPAFACAGVKAVATETERLRRKISELLQLVSEEALGRKIAATEQGVIHRGMLRWRRQWIWGVLRRQHLRLYTDDSCTELTGPKEVDLTDCICSSGSEWEQFRSYPSFTVYRPVNVPGSATRSYFCHVFQVREEEDRQRWVLLVQEATQISESCHRIEKFHESLRAAPTREEYERAIRIVHSETMVIPVEWVVQKVRSKHRRPSLQQAMKDLQRDRVTVDGVLFDQPTGDDLASHICARVLEAAGHPQEEHAEVKAAVLARDVLLSCSRTQGGGDILDTVQLLFGHDLVHCNPEADVAPVLIRVLCRTAKAPEGDVLASMGPDTGVPQFQRDENAKHLSTDVVRAMDLQKAQTIRTAQVDSTAWVPDHQMVQCMKCGERFNPFLRRHHCRACGALVCYSCSRHFVPLAPAAGQTGDEATADPAYELIAGASAHRERVCFTCYQRAVIRDLNARKERGQSTLIHDDEDSLRPQPSGASSSSDTCCEDSPGRTGRYRAEQPGSNGSGTAADVAKAPEDPWPVISVELSSTYKIISFMTDEPVVWFVLDCKYVKVVRWSGLADEGRVTVRVRPAGEPR